MDSAVVRALATSQSGILSSFIVHNTLIHIEIETKTHAHTHKEWLEISGGRSAIEH